MKEGLAGDIGRFMGDHSCLWGVVVKAGLQSANQSADMGVPSFLRNGVQQGGSLRKGKEAWQGTGRQRDRERAGMVSRPTQGSAQGGGSLFF